MTDDTTLSLPSGRFLLRLDPRLHAFLKEAAQVREMSLNQYCTSALSAPGVVVPEPLGFAVAAAGRVAGDALEGVAVYGSWARGESRPESDIDLLVVLKSGTPIRRDLYRAWDEAIGAEEATWEGLPIAPQIVALPEGELGSPSVWAEAALDAIALYDPNFSLGRRFAAIRRRIADGTLRRRTSQGHAYWVVANLEAQDGAGRDVTGTGQEGRP